MIRIISPGSLSASATLVGKFVLSESDPLWTAVRAPRRVTAIDGDMLVVSEVPLGFRHDGRGGKGLWFIDETREEFCARHEMRPIQVRAICDTLEDAILLLHHDLDLRAAFTAMRKESLETLLALDGKEGAPSETLRPCPFCGSAGKITRVQMGEYLVQCAGVRMCMGQDPDRRTGFTYRDDAIRLWNTRQTPVCEAVTGAEGGVV